MEELKMENYNITDIIPDICKNVAQRNDAESSLYLACLDYNLDTLIAFGTCQDDFYNIRNITNKLIYKKTSPVGLLTYLEIHNRQLEDYQKEAIYLNYKALLDNVRITYKFLEPLKSKNISNINPKDLIKVISYENISKI